jgi:hypothetical protein
MSIEIETKPIKKRDEAIRSYFVDRYKEGLRSDVIVDEISEKYFVTKRCAIRILSPMRQLLRIKN